MTGRPTPRLEIRLDKVVDNATALASLCASRGIRFTPVMKAVRGSPRLAAALHGCGIRSFADSRIGGLRAMRESGLRAEYMLIRCPTPSQVHDTVEWADVSLNTEIGVVRELARAARRRGVRHRVILMIELGDLREGILPSEIDEIVAETIRLDGITLAGIGTNLACLSGVSPSAAKMRELSSIADRLEHRHRVHFEYVSGGNSANYRWLLSTRDPGRVNHLRIGESMLLGCDALTREAIPGMHTDAFTLIAEVAEVRDKPSLPDGDIVQDAFGGHPRPENRGIRRRAIVAIGRGDIEPTTLRPRIPVEIVGATSDHLALDVTETGVRLGDEVAFDVGYSSLLRAMISRDVAKVFTTDQGPPGAGSVGDPGNPIRSTLSS